MSLDTIDSGLTPGTTQVGTIAIFVAGNVPLGWFLANGQAISRTTYGTLFSIAGTSFGSGNGSTTFNVPTIANPGTNLVYAIKAASLTVASATLLDG